MGQGVKEQCIFKKIHLKDRKADHFLIGWIIEGDLMIGGIAVSRRTFLSGDPEC